MKPDTWQAIEIRITKFPGAHAEGVPPIEIDAAAAELGVSFPEDFQEFLRRYGGGQAGSFSVARLRRWQFAGQDDWSITDHTKHYRDQNYPGSDRWAIFSSDGSGNPIGFDELGRVWLSDHDSCEFVCLESSFENWVRRWALRVEPHTRRLCCEREMAR